MDGAVADDDAKAMTEFYKQNPGAMHKWVDTDISAYGFDAAIETDTEKSEDAAE